MICIRRSTLASWIMPAGVAFVLFAQGPSAAQKLLAVPTAGVLSPTVTPRGTALPVLPPAGLYADPAFVSLSPGSALTAEDIRLFDNMWMNQDQHDFFIHVMHNAFWIGYDPFGVPYTSVVWMIGERMAAMARMYELTRAPKYLDELRELTNLVLAGRDDHIDLQPEPEPQYNPAFQPNPPSRADGLRGNRVMPAWGYRSVGYGGFHSSDLVVAGVYAYPIAAFARIVAEDPTLYATYGADAKAAATGILEMLEAFWPELHDQSLTPGGENYFANPPGNRLLTYETCSQGYSAALRLWYAGMSVDNDSAWAYEDGQALEAGYQKCYTDFRAIAGYPLAHNEYQAFVMALIELSRALDSDLYKRDLTRCEPLLGSQVVRSSPIARQSLLDSPAAVSSPIGARCRPQYAQPPQPPLQYVELVARGTIPTIVAGAQRYYRNRFNGVFFSIGLFQIFANMYQSSALARIDPGLLARSGPP